MIPVTVIIPVKNEEVNLPHCLEALQGFAHIVVVDSGSMDNTQKIAKKKKVEIINFEWNGHFPKKRNWMLQQYSFQTDWVLFLDADETITNSFKEEVEISIQDKKKNGYWLTYHNYFQNRLLKYGIPFKKLALFRIGTGKYERIDEDRWSTLDMEIHEHPMLDGPVGEIKSPIIHNDYKGLYHYLARHNEYSSWEAKRFLKLHREDAEIFRQLTPRQQKKYQSLDKWWWAPSYFIVNYFLRLGFLDGREGFIFSLLKAIYFFEIRCKILETNKTE